MVKFIQPQGPPEVVEFPKYYNADIEWCGRMPTDPPLVDPRVEMLLGQCEDEYATPEETNHVTDNWLPHWDR